MGHVVKWGVIRDDMAFSPNGVIWVLINFGLMCHSSYAVLICA